MVFESLNARCICVPTVVYLHERFLVLEMIYQTQTETQLYVSMSVKQTSMQDSNSLSVCWSQISVLHNLHGSLLNCVTL